MFHENILQSCNTNEWLPAVLKGMCLHMAVMFMLMVAYVLVAFARSLGNRQQNIVDRVLSNKYTQPVLIGCSSLVTALLVWLYACSS